YADIRANATFERSLTHGVLTKLAGDRLPVVTIVGAAGVGKTTFGRQLLSKLYESGFAAYEHKVDFAFKHQPWIDVEANLRSKGMKGVLLLDECTRYLRQVNLLVEHLATVNEPALKLVLTANAAQWSVSL